MEEKTNTPTLRFRGFEAAWEKKTVEEITQRVIVGLATSVTPYYRKKGTPILRNLNIRENYLDDRDILFLDKDYADKQVGKMIHTGDVLTVHTGYIGTSCVVPEKYNGCLTFTTLITTTDENQISGNFFAQYLNSPKGLHSVKIVTTQGGRQNLNTNDFIKVQISYPSLNEQNEIEKFLASLDKRIFAQEQKIKKLEQFRQAMLTKLFPAEGASEPALRFHGFSGPWKTARLGDLGTTYGGLNGKTKKDFGHGAGRFVTYLNIFNNPIADLQGIEAVELDKTQNQVKYGDIFFTTSSETPEEVGMSSVWLGNEENVYLNSFCFGYRPLNNLYPFFMAYLLRSTSVRKKFIFLAQGISRYNISKNRVMDMYIPLPPIEEQKKIGDFLYSLDNFLSLQKEKLDKMRLLKAALLDKLFV